MKYLTNLNFVRTTFAKDIVIVLSVADLNVQIGRREITKFCIHAVIADVQVLSAKKGQIDI